MNRVIVERARPTAAALEQLLAAWPYKPHRWGWAGTPAPLTRLVVGRVQQVLAAEDVLAWSAVEGDRLIGIAVLQPLAWDSRMLGLPAGRIELYVDGRDQERRAAGDALLAACLGTARQRPTHLSIRVDAADDAVIHGLESHGFLNVDALMTFAAAAADLPAPAPIGGIVMRAATADDAGAVAAIAAEAFQHGRFHADPSIPAHRARELYAAWGAACCTGAAADATLVADNGTAPVGFIACRMIRDTAVHLQRPTGTIPLVAAGEAVRGRGVGGELVAAAAEWFRDHDAVMVEVGTQLRNTAAARLYERCGFRLAAGSLSFRLMIEP